MVDTKYSFGRYEFSDKEIDQIVSLTSRIMSGAMLPIDKRRYSKQVLDYALDWHLVKHDNKRLVPDGRFFTPTYELPAEALWRMCKPMVDTATGYSIVNSERWHSLNIYPQNCRHATDKDFNLKVETFDRLASFGYIWFQYAGSVWQITVRRAS